MARDIYKRERKIKDKRERNIQEKRKEKVSERIERVR